MQAPCEKQQWWARQVTGIIPSSPKGKTSKKAVIEYELYELLDSDFSKAAARLFDKIDNGKAGVIPLSKFVEFIETHATARMVVELAGHHRKLYLNKIGISDHFAFVRWYVDK